MNRKVPKRVPTSSGSVGTNLCTTLNGMFVERPAYDSVAGTVTVST